MTEDGENIHYCDKRQYFTKHITNQPCDFCIDFTEKSQGNHIYKDEDGQFNIMADTGDSFQWGAIENIKYCPYCGRRLN